MNSSNPLDLGYLAFTADEIRRWPHTIDTDDTYANIAEHCNRILAEKLAKAPVVSMGVDAEIWYPGDVTEYGAIKTHTARLVCIEELKK